MYINDCHVHLGRLPHINHHFTEEDIDAHIDKTGVDQIIVIPTHIDYEIDRVKGYANRDDGVYGLQWINEHTHPNDIVDDENIVGAKFHGAYSNYSRPKGSVLKKLNDDGKILMFHTGRYKDGNAASNTSYLHALEVAKNHPKLKVILAHMGGTDTRICQLAVDEVRRSKLDNVWFDTSGITTPYIIEYAVNLGYEKRILFGSDIPWCSWNAQYATVDEARVSKSAKWKIFEENFNELL